MFDSQPDYFPGLSGADIDDCALTASERIRAAHQPDTQGLTG